MPTWLLTCARRHQSVKHSQNSTGLLTIQQTNNKILNYLLHNMRGTLRIIVNIQSQACCCTSHLRTKVCEWPLRKLNAIWNKHTRKYNLFIAFEIVPVTRCARALAHSSNGKPYKIETRCVIRLTFSCLVPRYDSEEIRQRPRHKE